MAHHPHRVRRWLIGGALGLVGLVVLAVVAVFVILQTPWGRSTLERKVVAALDDVLEGEIEIGAIDGNLADRAVLRDVVIRDPAGRETLRAPRIAMRYRLFDLASRRLHVRSLELVDPVIHVEREADGTLNVSHLLTEKKDDGKKPGKPWTLDIDRARIVGGKVTFKDGAQTWHVKDVSADLGVEQRGADLQVSIAAAQLHVVERDATIKLRGRVHKTAEELRLTEVTVSSGGTRIAIDRAVLAPDLKDGSGSFAVTLDDRDLRKLDPRLADLRGDLAVAGTVSRERPEDPWAVQLAGTLAAAPVSIRGTVDPESEELDLALRLDRFDPRRAWATAPPASMTISAQAKLAGFAPERAEGKIHVESHGSYQGHRVDQLVIDATPRRGTIDVTARGRAPGAEVDAEGKVVLVAGQVAVRDGKLHAVVPQLARFLPAKLRVRGDVAADLRFAGTPDAMAVTGTVRSRRLQVRDLRAARASVVVDLTGLPRAPSGKADLSAADLRQKANVLGPVRASAVFAPGARQIDVTLSAGTQATTYAARTTARITRTPQLTRVDVGTLRVRARRLVWDGSGAHLSLHADGHVEAAGIDLRSTAGRIKASGSLGHRGDRLDLTLEKIRIEEIRRALAPDSAEVIGLVDAHIVVARRRGVVSDMEAKVSARGLELRPKVDPIDLDVTTALRGRDLVAALSIDGGRTGRVKLDLETRTPVDPANLEAWRSLDERDVRKVDLALTKVDLVRVSDLLDLRYPLSGTVDVQLQVGKGLTTANGNVFAHAVEVPQLGWPLSGNARFDLRGGALDVAAAATRPGGGSLGLTAKVATPRRVSDLEAWKQLTLDDVELATVRFAGVQLAWIDQVRARFPEVRGVVSGTVVAKAKGPDVVTADVRADGVQTARLHLPVHARLRSSLFQDKMTVRLDSQVGQQRFLDADVTMSAGLTALRQKRMEALEQAPVRGVVRADSVPLAIVRDALKLETQLSGNATLHGEVTGKLADPVVDLRFALSPGTRVAGAVFTKLGVTGHLDPQRITVRAEAAQQAGGTLSAVLDADRRNTRRASIKLDARQLDLSFLTVVRSATGASISAGKLEGKLTIDGERGQRTAYGSLRLHDARLRLSEYLETFEGLRLDVDVAQGGALTVKLETRAGEDGSLSLDARGKVVGLSVPELTGTFRSKRLSVSTGRQLAEVTTRGELTAHYDGKEVPQLDLNLRSTEVKLPGKLGGGKVHPTGEMEDVVFVDEQRNTPYGPEPPEVATLRVRIETRRPILVVADELRIQTRVDLRAVVFPRETSLRGRIMVDTGWVELFDRRWEVRASTLAFGGENPMNPRLNLQMDHEFRTTTVHVAVRGTLREPRLELTSDEGRHDRSQLLGFLLGGNPDEPAQPDADVSQRALDAASGVLFGQLTPVIKQVVPVDVLSVKRRSGAAEETVITVGKWLSTNVFVAYHHRFGEDEADEIQNAHEGALEWYFLRQWRLDLLFGDRGEGSADVLWIKRW